jgi:aspartokinase-like uncharacterized kinase
MARDALFLKISGKLLDDFADRTAFLDCLKDFARVNPECLFYIVPGGGKKVDDLRAVHRSDPGRVVNEWHARHGDILDAEGAAHWRAIEIMDENGDLLLKSLKGCENVIVPRVSHLMKERKCNLPWSWDITSDSIVYWLATALAGETDDLPWIILLKQVDGVVDPGTPGISFPRRSRRLEGKLVDTIIVKKGKPRPSLSTYPFDTYMFVLVQEFKIPFYIVNWHHIERVSMLLGHIPGGISTKVMPVA